MEDMDLAHLALALYSSKVQSNEMLSSWSKGRSFPIQWCHRSILQSIHDLPSRSRWNTPTLRDSGPLQPQYTRAASLGWMQKHCNKLLGTWRFAAVFEPLRGRTKDLNIVFFHILSRKFGTRTSWSQISNNEFAKKFTPHTQLTQSRKISPVNWRPCPLRQPFHATLLTWAQQYVSKCHGMAVKYNVEHVGYLNCFKRFYQKETSKISLSPILQGAHPRKWCLQRRASSCQSRTGFWWNRVISVKLEFEHQLPFGSTYLILLLRKCGPIWSNPTVEVEMEGQNGLMCSCFMCLMPNLHQATEIMHQT